MPAFNWKGVWLRVCVLFICSFSQCIFITLGNVLALENITVGGGWGDQRSMSTQSFLSFIFFFGGGGSFQGHTLKRRYMELPRLGVEWELQPPAYTTATATPDWRHVCNLHHSLQQYQILNPLSKAMEQTCILMDTSQVLLSRNGNSTWSFLFIEEVEDEKVCHPIIFFD